MKLTIIALLAIASGNAVLADPIVDKYTPIQNFKPTGAAEFRPNRLQPITITCPDVVNVDPKPLPPWRSGTLGSSFVSASIEGGYMWCNYTLRQGKNDSTFHVEQPFPKGKKCSTSPSKPKEFICN